MAVSHLETDKLILRHFNSGDIDALFLLLRDEEVNMFLPWFPVKTIEETQAFFERRLAGQRYCFAVCLRDDNLPIGYVQADENEGHDFGYALRREYWHRGLAAEAGRALIGQLRRDGVPYITATHDRNNPRSGAVMRRLGMRYRYSYEELWQPKNFLVTFRMFQLNLDGREERIYRKYWERYDRHFIEDSL